MSVVRIDIARRHRRRHRRLMRILYIIGIIAVCVLIMGAFEGNDKIVSGYEYTTTDTLWGLLEYCPEDMDRWEYLGIVMELNGMSDRVVYPNRIYQVPIFEKKERNVL